MISLLFSEEVDMEMEKTSHLLDRYSSMLMHFQPFVRLFSTPNGLHCIISCFLRVRNQPDFKGNSGMHSHPAAQICKDVTKQGLVCICVYIYIQLDIYIYMIYVCPNIHVDEADVNICVNSIHWQQMLTTG